MSKSINTDMMFEFAGRIQDMQEQILRKEYENPDAVKRSPTFTQQQTANYLGIPRSSLQDFVKRNPDAPRTMVETKTTGTPITRFSTQDIVHLREMLGLKPKPIRKDGRPFVLSVGNLKGGAGKTTVSIHLAQYLALKGYRVLAIDADPQGSLTNLLGFFPFPVDGLPKESYFVTEENSLSNLFINMMPLCPAKTYWGNLDIVTNNIEGYSSEYSLASLPTRYDTPFHNVLEIALKTKIEEWKSKDAFKTYFARLAEIDPEGSDYPQDPYELEGPTYDPDEYDIVIIDTPPSYSYSTQNALYASDALVMSIPAYHLDLLASGHYLGQLGYLFTSITDYYEESLKALDFISVIPLRINPQDSTTLENYSRMMTAFGEHVTPPIPALKAVTAGASHNKTVYEIMDDVNIVSKTTSREAIATLEAAFDSIIKRIEEVSDHE